jgi:hypothetical protein
MKYASNPEKEARRIFEIANAVVAGAGRIIIEKVNEPFLFRYGGNSAEYGAALAH